MNARPDPRSNVAEGDYWHEGEVFAMPERIVVAQARGRAYPEAVEGGTRVRRGAVLVHLLDGDSNIDVPAPVAGTLTAWFVESGTLVEKGEPLVSIRRLQRR